MATPGLRIGLAGQDYRPAGGSQCIDAGTGPHAAVLPEHDVALEYSKHLATAARPKDGLLDIGAFEFQPALTFFLVAAVGLGLVRAKLWQLRQVHLCGFGRLAAFLWLRTVYRRLGGGCRFRVGRGRFLSLIHISEPTRPY